MHHTWPREYTHWCTKSERQTHTYIEKTNVPMGSMVEPTRGGMTCLIWPLASERPAICILFYCFSTTLVNSLSALRLYLSLSFFLSMFSLFISLYMSLSYLSYLYLSLSLLPFLYLSLSLSLPLCSVFLSLSPSDLTLLSVSLSYDHFRSLFIHLAKSFIQSGLSCFFF